MGIAFIVEHCVRCMRGMPDVWILGKNPCNGNLDISQKVLWSSNEMPFHYRPIATKLASSVTHARTVRGMKFEGNLSNRSQDKAENALYSTSKVLYSTDRSQPNLHRLYLTCRKYEVRNFRKIPPMETHIHTKKKTFSNYSALLYWPISTTAALLEPHEWKVREMKFQKNPCHESQRTAEKVLCSPTERPLICDLSEPKSRHL
jgi:hypothetical protein